MPMPFFRRKKQPLTFPLAEQLPFSPSPTTNPDHSRFSDPRLPTDRPLHQPHPHQQYQPAPSPTPAPTPAPAHIRRTQTHHFSLPDSPPTTANPRANTTTNDDTRKLHKKTLLNHSPPSSSTTASSTSTSPAGFLGRSLSVKTPRSRPTTTPSTGIDSGTGTAAVGRANVVTSSSISEISMPNETLEPLNQPQPVSQSQNRFQNERNTSVNNLRPDTTTTTTNTATNTTAATQYQPYHPPSQQSITSLSINNPDAAQAMAAPGQSAQPAGGAGAGAGRQSPYPPDAKNPSRTSLEQGRGTPGPGQKEEDVRGLVQKHDELLAKYAKVKRYYFEKDAQVQHLQNTVAHQRMAVSRTVLDDNEYANRFGRLDGAIKDLAFSIRKDWKDLPPWLIGFVNDNAHEAGTKEMTAVGRAVMSRWLVEEIFNRHFHPTLEPTLSQQLKDIENNLRQQLVNKAIISEEDKENAIAKISNWRRTTFDGLGDAQLHGQAAEENRAKLIDHLVAKLVASLEMHLNSPPPPGMDNGARMIVENAVGIAEKIPLESRDVCVEYPLPGSILDDQHMKPETGISPLTNVKPENRQSLDQDTLPTNPAGQGQGQASDPTDPDEKDTSSSSSSPSSPPVPSSTDGQKKKTSSSVFSSLMGKRSPPGPATSALQDKEESQGQGQGQAEQGGAGAGTKRDGRIRFASFMNAEVRGKGPMSMLAKAPVYLIE